MKITLPVYQHPTLVILVDDSPSFIESLEFQMNPSIAVKSFQDASEALRWLDASYNVTQEKWLPIRVGYDEQTLSFERRTIALDVDQIYRIVMDPQRFYAPAVVVVDYAMPQINGIDFCRALKRLPCKKILFTGEANEMVAVDAFNQGLIDRYLKKSDPQALDRLELEIAVLEREYFVEKSGTLKDLLVKHSFSFLSDEIFAKLVNALSEQYRFVEHFLFPDPSGILFVDADGKSTLMVVETKVGLTSHLETAQDYGAPAELQAALKGEKIVPFFWASGGMYTEKSQDWEQYCLPAQICAGREDYFWALFDLPQQFLNGPVYPYNKFLTDRAQISSL
jgi:CheY-like chemotaxis protein